ncbi:MAG TPA: cation-translocating P-type ATPase, partial [Blastocatellia bacterium]|nr:cation-translocating P-type ATPase [Blastocatellia bacterium]
GAERSSHSTLEPVSPSDHERRSHPSRPDETPDHNIEWADMARIGFVAIAILAMWLRVWEPFPRFSVIGVTATLIGIYPILKEAVAALLERRMTMELSMTIAIGAALAIGEFFTALVIALFVLVAEVLEGLTVGRGRRAIKDLLDFLPQNAFIRGEAGAQDEVAISQIKAGDIVVVKPGSRIPVDGTVSKGHSFVDQSTVTGESMPVEKLPGASVYAGTINQSGALDVRVEGVGLNTAFGRIIQAVESAEKSRAPIQKTADRLAGYLVYFAIACAALTFGVTHNIKSTISVIIVAGACGIAAGTPLAILGAIGLAARQGAIVKGGLYIEALAAVDTVVLDKTGTVTFGDPEVTGVHPAPGVKIVTILQTAAIAERRSEHPLGYAIIKKFTETLLPLPETDRFYYIPGKGIVCVSEGDEIVVGNRGLMHEFKVDIEGLPFSPDHSSEILVARKGRLLGSIRIADVLRTEAVQAVTEIKRMGLRTVLLTGDAQPTARAIGEKLGIDDIGAEMLPDQKLKRIKTLMYTGRKVAMVGDGINDAPALMQANVGVAMGSGTDVARESADVMLIGNDLIKLVETIRIARRCHRIIMFNFAGTLAVDAAGVALAAFGFLNPLLAAFIHVTSEMAFILNSARLLPRGPIQRAKTRSSVTSNTGPLK